MTFNDWFQKHESDYSLDWRQIFYQHNVPQTPLSHFLPIADLANETDQFSDFLDQFWNLLLRPIFDEMFYVLTKAIGSNFRNEDFLKNQVSLLKSSLFDLSFPRDLSKFLSGTYQNTINVFIKFISDLLVQYNMYTNVKNRLSPFITFLNNWKTRVTGYRVRTLGGL